MWPIEIGTLGWYTRLREAVLNILILLEFLAHVHNATYARAPEFSNRLGESCGSSVVEHSLGKGEVESSILSRSTSKSQANPRHKRTLHKIA
jgi:hypothetical protein